MQRASPRRASSFDASARLQAAWLGRGPIAVALLPLALLYGLLTSLRKLAYDAGLLGAERLGVPVVVVGNVIAGGAGKTPTTMAIVDYLRRRGERPGILSRGYGRKHDATLEVQPDSDPAEVGDEPLLMHLRTGVPVMVGRDRAAAGHALLAAHPDLSVLVCDDGLQHLRLARDLEILVFDERGTGNGWYLPAGPLRESAERRADLVLYNAEAPSTPRPGFLAHRLLGPAIALGAWRRGEREGSPLASFRGRRLLAAAGIAHPQRFFAMLESEGLVFERLPLPDHHDYTLAPWQNWNGEVVLVTEKDAVKLRGEALESDPRVFVVTLDFHPEAAFLAALDRLLPPR